MIKDLPADMRRQADRLEYLGCVRAAHRARLHAAAFEAMASNVVEDLDLGRYADEAATAVRRGYVTVAMKLLEIADECDSNAASYRDVLGAAG